METCFAEATPQRYFTSLLLYSLVRQSEDLISFPHECYRVLRGPDVLIVTSISY